MHPRHQQTESLSRPPVLFGRSPLTHSPAAELNLEREAVTFTKAAEAQEPPNWTWIAAAGGGGLTPSFVCVPRVRWTHWCRPVAGSVLGDRPSGTNFAFAQSTARMSIQSGLRKRHKLAGTLLSPAAEMCFTTETE